VPPIPGDLKSALAGRYELQRVVGIGGMATVYLARDSKHGREVAVKVLRPDLAATVGSERFLREIDIAARLTHPNILGLHDSGEADEFLYYVMPFVAGGSLRGRLKQDGTLPVEVAVRIIREVAEALSYAHREGVIHRDIKPENILFSEGHAIVADFGIAKAIITAGGENLTRSGFPLGTPGYMSPEQAAGMTSLDERTDVYGIGCVFYEMLVGETPGLWLTEDAVRLGRFVDAETKPRERLDGLPGRLEQVMTRSLAMRLADRCSTPMEFVGAVSKAARGTEKLSDDEVSEIVNRAAELQAEYPTEAGRLTIGVLEEVIVEVGVLPERLREAAEEVGGDIISEGGYATGEVEEIIRRAVELEAKYSEDGWAMSLGGVEQVGAEVGIAPDFIRNAAGELARPDDRAASVARGGSGFFGRSPVLRVDRFVDREVSGPETANLVEEIRTKLDIVGHVSAAGTSLTWVSSVPGEAERNIRVTISAGAGRTSIHIEENITDLSRQLAGGFVGLMSGGLIGIGFGVVTGDPGIGSLFVAIFAAAGAYVFPRSDFMNIANRHESELEELGDRLAELAAGRGELPTANKERPTSK
jgi:hypothetical protein